jgi:O-succinylhomoserine sulfhydrylase
MSTENNSIDHLALASKMVHGGTERSQFGETSEALYLTQGYVYDSPESAEARFSGDAEGHVYSRYSNPTVEMFEKRMCALENAPAARGTASGMAAVNAALMTLVKAGDHVVAAKALFGSCRYIVEDLLPRFGVETTLIDGCSMDEWDAALRPDTKACFFESPTNPVLDVIDIAGVCERAHAVGAKVVVDNVFATPIQQKPLALGADVVVYSATKHIDGQGRCLGGVILGQEDYIEEVHTFLKHTGPSLSPFNAWVLLKGLETLPLRVAHQTKSAGILADRLKDHSAVNWVRYPGRADHPQREIIARQMSDGSTMVAIEVKNGKAGAFSFENNLSLIKISNNLGDAKSLVTHPATTTHQRLEEAERAELGISDGVVRLSVGLEDPEDLWADIDQALNRV